MKMFKRSTLRFEFVPILLAIASLAVFAAIVGITIFIIKKIKEKDAKVKTEADREKELADKTPIYPPAEEAKQAETNQNPLSQEGNVANNSNTSPSVNGNNILNDGNKLNNNLQNNNTNNSENNNNNNLDNLYNKNPSQISPDVPKLNLENNKEQNQEHGI